MAKRINAMPQDLKDALLKALIAAGASLPTDDDPVDGTPTFMLEAIRAEEPGTSIMEILRTAFKGSGKRVATREESAMLVELAGPCRFKVGDRVRWNPALHPQEADFPDMDDIGVVTQVFNPAMHCIADNNSNQAPVRNDFAMAYMNHDGEGNWHLHEFAYDSRRFLKVED